MREITQDETIEIRRNLLEVFHQLCQENGLKYSLGYGTLLGAVRHKGMIPWDDDIDIVMPRKDYDQLEKMYAAMDSRDRYQFVNHRNHPEIKTKIGYFIDFTTRMEVAGVVNEYQGVHIDVYPVDVLPTGSVAKAKYLMKRKMLHKLIRGKDVHPELLNGKQKLIRQIVKILLSPVKQDKILDRLNSVAKMYAYIPEDRRKTVCCYCEAGSPQCFPYSVITEYVLYDFDGKQYFGFRNFDAPLKAWYGDYMTPPKEEDRHRPNRKWVRFLYKE